MISRVEMVSGERTSSAPDVTQREFVDGQRLFGRYTLIRILGKGGMGIVWLAHDEELERDVALKFLPDLIIQDAAVLNDLKRETRRCLELTHKNIVRIYDFVHDERSGCISMEYVDGDTLSSLRCDKERKVFEAAELTDWMAQLCDALDYAHNYAHVIHRDLKPANLMVNQRGELKVSDFGIARSLGNSMSVITMQQGRSGTLAYMSPQQLEGEYGTHLDDIYSLGASVYELLTGKPPFYAGNIDRQIREKIPPSMADRRREFEIEGAPIPAVWEEWVAACLAKGPARRPQSVTEIARQLQMPSPETRPQAMRSFFPRSQKRVLVLALASLCLLALAVGGWYFEVFKPAHPKVGVVAPVSTATTAIPEKSIAVLPFENRSEDKANAYFADGVQDEILTDLSRIADLKVISRASVIHYKSGIARNLREIGQQLGVANVVEGSVQRAGNRVRVNAQLVDARTDKHLWAQTYDRDLADVFAIQSEIAEAIADQLQAKLSPSEKKAIEQPPTIDLAAFDLYSRAKLLLLTAASNFSVTSSPDVRRAVELLDEAVKRDSSFFDAYCHLAYAHEWLYAVSGVDHTPARLALAEAALQAALRLRPDAGETHLARANYLYFGRRDYAGALAELEIARRALPNDPRIFESTGYILRRRGQQEEGLRNLQRALELDPRNFSTLQQIANSYANLRRYAEANATLDRALNILPDNVETRTNRGLFELCWRGDTRPLHQIIDTIVAQGPNAIVRAADSWFLCALAERNAAAAERALVALGNNPCWSEGAVHLSRSFGEGLLARMTKDEARAHAAFAAARAQQEKIVQAQPEYGPPLCVLAMIDAGLGRKDLAMEEGRRAIVLMPLEKDVMTGSRIRQYFAITAAWAGEKELALQQLETGLRAPAASVILSYGALKLLPFWDPLRGDPRFEKLVEEIKVPVALSASESSARSDANFAPVAEKSIGVLPFENRSRDPDNAYFAEGIQDEILTRLSKIADLKVISRTSTQHYKNAPENLPEIARQLGVAHILEGSVQKSGDVVRVNVQLIKAANDTHLWAETFDRKLTDIFSVESEVARAIADQLRAKLTGEEEQRIAAKPTDNLEAYDAYLRGRAFAGGSPFDKPNVERTINSYQEAVKLDPNFALAWAYLSCAQSTYYWLGFDPSPAGLAAAKHAADRALALDPSLAETHLALGYYRYYGQRDYTGGLAEFQQAEKALPNNVDVIFAIALIQRRLGHWDEAIVALRRVIELDPRDINAYNNLAITYGGLRRFPEALATVDRALAFEAANGHALFLKARFFQATGDLQAAEALLTNPGISPGEGPPWVLVARGLQALFRRRYGAAIENFSGAVAADTKRGELSADDQFLLGLSQQRAGDVAAARATYKEAVQDIRRKLENVAPDSYPAANGHIYLGLAYAGLGETAFAIAEGQTAMAILPTSKDPFQGPGLEQRMAQIYALLGDGGHAIPILNRLLQTPYGGVPVTPALLRLDPVFDPIRNDPRFQKLASGK